MPAGPQKPAGILTSTTIQVNTIMLFATLLAATAFAQTVDPTIGIGDHIDITQAELMQSVPLVLDSSGNLVTLPTIGSALNAHYNGSIPFTQAISGPITDIYPSDMTQWADNFGTIIVSVAELGAIPSDQTFELGSLMYTPSFNQVWSCTCPQSCSSADCMFNYIFGGSSLYVDGLELSCNGQCASQDSSCTEENGTSTSDPQNTEGETSSTNTGSTFNECDVPCTLETKTITDPDYDAWLQEMILQGGTVGGLP